MTILELRNILSGMTNESPVYLYLEGREKAVCLCGEVLTTSYENYCAVKEGRREWFPGEETVCLVLSAGQPL